MTFISRGSVLPSGPIVGTGIVKEPLYGIVVEITVGPFRALLLFSFIQVGGGEPL